MGGLFESKGHQCRATFTQILNLIMLKESPTGIKPCECCENALMDPSSHRDEGGIIADPT